MDYSCRAFPPEAIIFPTAHATRATMVLLSLTPEPNNLTITTSTTLTFSAAHLSGHNPRLSLPLTYHRRLTQYFFSNYAFTINPINPTLLSHYHVLDQPFVSKRTFHYFNHHDDGSCGGGGCGGGGWNNFYNSDSWWRDNDGGGDSANIPFLLCSLSRFSTNSNGEKLCFLYDKTLLFFLALCFFSHCGFASPTKAVATVSPAKDGEKSGGEEKEIVYEVKGGKRIELVPDYSRDIFVIPQWYSWSWSSLLASGIGFPDLWKQCKDVCVRLMLPAGFPDSVTCDYLQYSLWRGVQGVAAQISGVLATQSLLYAVGLGKGAIPTAAALNWVFKDGIGYLGKILLSKFGRHFDVHPKGWRLFADLLENTAYGLEILTPAFPHLFVPIGAAAGAGRSAAALIQASTRSCFYAGFAAQRNFAEVIAKGEAQGMVSKSIGIALGIALANCIRSSTPLALASFGVVTWVHMFCNLKSYQSIQLRTLNPYRASLVFSEYLLSGLVPSVKEVNDEEPLFPAVPVFNIKPVYKVQLAELSTEAKDAAAKIVHRLQLGSKLSDVVKCKDDAVVLFDLYRHEGYILTEHEGRFCVILKESSVPRDMLKSLFHVSYLYWLEENAGIKSRSISDDCRPGGRLQISLDYVQREFNHVKKDGELAGWVTDGLIARPLPNRIRQGYAPPSV